MYDILATCMVLYQLCMNTMQLINKYHWSITVDQKFFKVAKVLHKNNPHKIFMYVGGILAKIELLFLIKNYFVYLFLCGLCQPQFFVKVKISIA